MPRREIIIDSFAGGGGASLGIQMATGQGPDVAINHDPHAIAMHAENHPETLHLPEDVWKVSPRSVLRIRRRNGKWQLPPEGWQEWPANQRVGLLWASPDCKHFSRAKGSKPVNKEIRSLAWVVCKWAAEIRPRVIVLENVREFAEWGPLLPAYRCGACNWRGTEGQATLVRTRRKCPRCESRRLKITGEQIPDPERKGLTFRRFIGRLRRLGYSVEFQNLNAADYGAPTHRRRLFLIARRDGRMIFWPEATHAEPRTAKAAGRKPWRTAAECIDWSIPCPSIFERSRPLAENTMRRIAMGIKRYVLEAAEPFLVCCNHGGAEFRGQPLDRPCCTLTGSRDAHGLVSPYLVRIGQGGSNGKHTNAAGEPLTTITSKAEHLIAAPVLVRYNTERSAGDTRSAALDQPLSTADTQNRFALVAPTLIQTGYGERDGQQPRALDLHTPLGTVVAGGAKHAVVAAFLAKHAGVPIDRPLPTVLSSGGHAALVYSFLIRYFGTAIGQSAGEPLYTITGKHRFGLVTVTIAGETYVIVDIGMRMLTPRELARAQGFPDSYKLTGTKSQQVARIGNSVCPQIAEAIVAANYHPQTITRRRKAAKV